MNLSHYLAIVLLIGLIAQWLAWRVRVPSILLLLGFGFVLGIYVKPEEVMSNSTLFPFISLSIAIILLEGGLTLKFKELRDRRAAVIMLCVVGIIVSTTVISIAARKIFDFTWPMAALLGSILSVTGPTVVGPLLAFIRPNRKVSALAKWEGIMIDPLGATLAVLVFQFIRIEEAGAAFSSTLLILFKTVAIGLLLGYGFSQFLVTLIRRHLIPEFLHSASILCVGIGVFVFSNQIAKESGLLSVTLLGIFLANQNKVSIRHVVEFKETLRALLLSFLFIVLSGRISWEEIGSMGAKPFYFLGVILLLARPASVWLSLIFAKVESKEKWFLSFLAPRGIVAATVSSFFALEIASENDFHMQQFHISSQALAPLTFFIIIGAAIFYGIVSPILARRLGLSIKNPQGILFGGGGLWAQLAAKFLIDEGYAAIIVDDKRYSVAKARLAGIPAFHANILSVYAGEELEFTGVGKFLAVTGDDDTNTLAVNEFIHLFGRENVYQVRSESLLAEKSRHAQTHHKRAGRRLFNENANFEKLSSLARRGAVIKKTMITKEFSYDDFRKLYGENFVPLFLKREKKLLVVCQDNNEPKENDNLIALVVEPEKIIHDRLKKNKNK